MCGKMSFSSVAVNIHCGAFMNGKHATATESNPGQDTLKEFIKVVKTQKETSEQALRVLF